MRVERLALTTVDLPIDLDLGARYGTLSTLRYVVVGLTGSGGERGVGFTFAMRPSGGDAIARTIAAVEGTVVGLDPADTESNWDALRAEVERAVAAQGDGPDDGEGVAAASMSALDVALWDLLGKAEGAPVHRLLGAQRETVPTYASYDMWESVPDREAARAAKRFVDEGFDAVKIRTGGSRDPDAEARRVAIVREAIGPDVQLMYDALQYYTEDEAIAIARALELYDLTWVEDLLPERNVEGYARVRDAVGVPITTGESTRFPKGLRRLVEAEAVDILMIDGKEAGGITPWMRVAREAGGLPIVSHIMPEISAPVIAALPNGMILEWFPWSFGLFETPPAAERGRYRLPAEPGFGLRYRPDLLASLFG